MNGFGRFAPCKVCQTDSPFNVLCKPVHAVRRGTVWIVECQHCGEAVPVVVPFGHEDLSWQMTAWNATHGGSL